jgi:hypothetical protein
MLWVNGYSGALAQVLKLNPKTGKPYWGKSVNTAGTILKDWNWMFIDPDMSFLSTPASLFKAGYHFALENDYIIRNNILLSGNLLQIVAHGRGIAFAEGISAYFYEEKGIVTDLSIYIQGTALAATPQSRRSVNCRLVVSSDGNKGSNILKFRDISIHENDLQNGFCKYAITLESKECDNKTSHLFFKGAVSGRSSRSMPASRPLALWSSIDHALKMHIENEVDAYATRIENVKNVVFEKFSMN